MLRLNTSLLVLFFCYVGTFARAQVPEQKLVNPLTRNGFLPLDGKIKFGVSGPDRFLFPGGIAVHSDGAFLVASAVYDPKTERTVFVLQRLSSEGEPNLGFGNQGAILQEVSGQGKIEQLVIYPDGRIFLLSRIPATRTIIAQRWTKTGKPDQSLMGMGKKEFKSFVDPTESGFHREKWRAVLDRENRLIVACFYGEGKEGGAIIERWLTNGNVDIDFGKANHRIKVPENPSSTRHYLFRAIAADSKNRPILGGTVKINWNRAAPGKEPIEFMRHHAALIRLTDVGQPDAAFNPRDPRIDDREWVFHTGEKLFPIGWKLPLTEPERARLREAGMPHPGRPDLQDLYAIEDLQVLSRDRILVLESIALNRPGTGQSGSVASLSLFNEAGQPDERSGFGRDGWPTAEFLPTLNSDLHERYPKLENLRVRRDGTLWAVGSIRKKDSEKIRVATIAEFDVHGQQLQTKVREDNLTDLVTNEGTGEVFTAVDDAGPNSRYYILAQSSNQEFTIGRYRVGCELDKKR